MHTWSGHSWSFTTPQIASRTALTIDPLPEQHSRHAHKAKQTNYIENNTVTRPLPRRNEVKGREFPRTREYTLA